MTSYLARSRGNGKNNVGNDMNWLLWNSKATLDILPTHPTLTIKTTGGLAHSPSLLKNQEKTS